MLNILCSPSLRQCSTDQDGHADKLLKPLALYEDLEKMQRDKESEDPMLALIKKKSKLQVERKGKPRKGTY